MNETNELFLPFSDGQIAVCEKPAGLLSEGEGKDALPSLLATQLGGEIYPVHRLDRETSGLMVFARTKFAAAQLSRQLTDGTLQKEYLAVLCGIPQEKQARLSDLLFYDRRAGKSFVVRKERKGVKLAEQKGYDMVFVDTAGRLQIDETLMEELENIKAAVHPTEILLTVDAMIGQESVNVADTFNQKLDITGVILTKLDGDTRGGAALSIRYVTGKPIKFIGVGEKLDAIEPFHPDRMANRILGMGDVLTLIDKAQQQFDEKKAAELEQKLRQSTFTLDDYLEQFQQIKNMGSLDQLAGMIPGMKPGALKDAQIDEKSLAHQQAIILAMTPAERERPEQLLNASRKKRIAQGSGTTVEEVNRLLKQFDQIKKMMKQFADMGRVGGKRGRGFGKKMKLPF